MTMTRMMMIEQQGGEQSIFEYIVMMTVIIKVDMTMTMMMMSMQSRRAGSSGSPPIVFPHQ